MKTQNDKVSEEVRELVYSDYNNKYEQLKSELNKLENGCGIQVEGCDEFGWVCCGHKWGKFDNEGEWILTEKTCLCKTCQAKIEYLKKGISACEEILNQCQQLKSEVSENSSLSEEAQTKGIVGEFNNNVKETSVETAGNPLGFSSQSADTPTLIQQREILIQKEINKFDEDESEILMTLHQLCRNCFDVGFKQALSQRNKEILEWLDNYSKENGEWYKYYVKIKELKEQLTTEGEGKK